jgi:hypothetical protein
MKEMNPEGHKFHGLPADARRSRALKARVTGKAAGYPSAAFFAQAGEIQGMMAYFIIILAADLGLQIVHKAFVEPFELVAILAVKKMEMFFPCPVVIPYFLMGTA